MCHDIEPSATNTLHALFQAHLGTDSHLKAVITCEGLDHLIIETCDSVVLSVHINGTIFHCSPQDTFLGNLRIVAWMIFWSLRSMGIPNVSEADTQ